MAASHHHLRLDGRNRLRSSVVSIPVFPFAALFAHPLTFLAPPISTAATVFITAAAILTSILAVCQHLQSQTFYFPLAAAASCETWKYRLAGSLMRFAGGEPILRCLNVLAVGTLTVMLTLKPPTLARLEFTAGETSVWAIGAGTFLAYTVAFFWAAKMLELRLFPESTPVAVSFKAWQERGKTDCKTSLTSCSQQDAAETGTVKG